MKKNAKQIEKPVENTTNPTPKRLSAKEWKGIGKKFHNLNVLGLSGQDKHGNVLLNCKCDCGKLKTLIYTKVKLGRVKSCGCRRKRIGLNNPLFDGYEDICKKFWYNIQKNAEKRKIKFNISMKYGWNLFLKQNKKCAYSGENLFFPLSYGKSDSNISLDRIDSSKGYIKGNVQWVLKSVNLAKHELTHKDFLTLVAKIYHFNH